MNDIYSTNDLSISNKKESIDKIVNLAYKHKNDDSFEKLYRIIYNFYIYNVSINNMCYLDYIYYKLDSRLCTFNNIKSILDVCSYAINSNKKKYKYNYNLIFEIKLIILKQNKKYKQNIIINCLINKINKDIIKKILFCDLSNLN